MHKKRDTKLCKTLTTAENKLHRLILSKNPLPRKNGKGLIKLKKGAEEDDKNFNTFCICHNHVLLYDTRLHSQKAQARRRQLRKKYVGVRDVYSAGCDADT